MQISKGFTAVLLLVAFTTLNLINIAHAKPDGGGPFDPLIGRR